MDWSEVIRKAVLVAEKQGYITFDQLNGLIPQDVAAEDVERLMEALSAKGVRIEEDIASTSGAEPSCSFCGKTQADVLQLIASAGPFICNECVQLCVGIIGTQNPAWLDQHRQFLGTLPLKPRDGDE